MRNLPNPVSSSVLPKKRKLWENLGGSVFSSFVILRIVLLVIGLVWVYQVIPAPKRNVDFVPISGGGGSPAEAKVSVRHQVKMVSVDLARTPAVVAASKLTIPEPDFHESSVA